MISFIKNTYFTFIFLLSYPPKKSQAEMAFWWSYGGSDTRLNLSCVPMEVFYWFPLLLMLWFKKYPFFNQKNTKSSHWRCSMKKVSLKYFATFIGKHLCWRLSLIKLQTWRPADLLTRDSNTGVFLWILRNF